jgi:asparagine synthase (glutamine-hydrolysing)
MCGIIGIYHFRSKESVSEEILQRLCSSVRHRGPDDRGTYTSASIGLGIQRLAVIDLATGRQPIHNEDKSIWIVFNGEIYNFASLRKELETEHSFSTNSDTEVILHLYEKYGPACVQRLRGMFAFAIWDETRQELFIARDRIGKKPLYYTVANGAFVFGSELKALRAYLPRTPEIDADAIDQFLTFQYIASPATIYQGISALPPAHTLTCRSDGTVTTENYWHVSYTEKTSLSFTDSCARIREILDESTRLRMIADVPLGTFLSGGHDSSIIVGLMSRHSAQAVKTFSIGFENEDFSELRYARIVANHFKTDHHELILQQHFLSLLPEIITAYDQPFADTSMLPTYLLSRETRRQVTVALSGDGGDETFGGYARYKALKSSRNIAFLFQQLGMKATRRLAGLFPHVETTQGKSPFRYLERFITGLALPPAERNAHWLSFFPPPAKEGLYTSAFREKIRINAFDRLAGVYRNAPASDLLDRSLYTDLTVYLPECLLAKVDIASMANSLEVRSPFLDHTLIEFAATLPSKWKVHGVRTKHILRAAFDDFLPSEIVQRGKTGFGMPVGRWFRSDWEKTFRDIVLSDRAFQRGYFNPQTLRQIHHDHVTGKRDNGYQMWALLVLEWWHRIYSDSPA